MWHADHMLHMIYRAASSSDNRHDYNKTINKDEAEIAICFLISQRFETLSVWSHWMQDPRIKGFIHYSNCAHKEVQEIETFAKETNSTIVSPLIETSWGTTSLTRAECILYDAAFRSKLSPNITHVWLVSEKTVPVISADDLVTYKNTTLHNKSQLAFIEDPNQSDLLYTNEFLEKIEKIDSDMKIQNVIFGNQFKFLCKNHWQLIRDNVHKVLNTMNPKINWSEKNQRMMHPDEFVIPTFLNNKNLSSEIEIGEKPVWDDFEDKEKRARVLTIDDIKCIIQMNNIRSTKLSSGESQKEQEPVAKKARKQKPQHICQINKQKEEQNIQASLSALKGDIKILGARKVMQSDHTILKHLIQTLIS